MMLFILAPVLVVYATIKAAYFLVVFIVDFLKLCVALARALYLTIK